MNKFAVITGASRGIGKKTAEYFLQNQWQVINIGRHACEIDNIVNIKADFSVTDWEKPLQQSLLPYLNSAKQICLVHNSAFYFKDSMLDISATQFRTATEVNMLAPILLNQLLIPQMNMNSSIIYIGSTLSEKGVANAASYIISKHAVVGMMRATCQDLAEKKIHTCCICPGFTETEMLRDHLKGDHAIYDMIKNKVTLKRLINPEEIARLIFFCAENPVINGSVLHANLGQIET